MAAAVQPKPIKSENAARQPRAAEDPVGQEGDRGEQAALFQQGERELEQHDLRQKGEDHPHRPEKGTQKVRRHGRASPFREGREPPADPVRQKPLERALAQHPRHPLRKREEKHGEQAGGKQRQREPRVVKQAVGEGGALPARAVHVFPERLLPAQARRASAAAICAASPRAAFPNADAMYGGCFAGRYADAWRGCGVFRSADAGGAFRLLPQKGAQARDVRPLVGGDR